MYGLMDLLVARVTELTADLRFHHKPSGGTIAPQVIATCMPERDSSWQEGIEWPHVLVAIYGGGFDRLEPQPHQVVVGCGIWTPGTIAEGTADIMELTAAVGRIVENRTFRPFKLRTPVRYSVGSEERGYEGTQPHPYHVSSIYLEFIKF